MAFRSWAMPIVALAAAYGLANVVRADSVTATLVNFIPFSGGSLYLDGSIISGDAVGELIWDGSGEGNPAPYNGTFTTFCLDLNEDIGFSQYTFTVQPDLSLAPKASAGGPMGPLKADEMEELYGAHFTSLSNSDELQAFQLALWNILYDTDTSVSDGQGDFYVVGGSADPGSNTSTIDSAAIADANEWLAEAADPLNQIYDSDNVQALIAPDGIQDQISTSVPLPPALFGGGLLMAAIGLVRRVRKPALQRQSI